MSKEIKNILFDFGGVIASLDKEKALNRFREIGLKNIEEYLNEFRQKGIFLEYEEGKIDAPNFYNEFRKLAGKDDVSDEDIDSAWLAFIADVPLYKLDLLKELRTKYKVYMLSNTNPSVMAWAMSPDFSSQGIPVREYFDKCYLSYEIGHAKPDVEIYHYILEDSGMIPSETLFIDDGKANVEAGAALGFKTYQANQDEDLRKAFVEMGLI